MFLNNKNELLESIVAAGCRGRSYQQVQRGLDKFMDSRSISRHQNKQAGMYSLTSLIQQLWMVGKYKRKGPQRVARVAYCSQIASATVTVRDNTLDRKRRLKKLPCWVRPSLTPSSHPICSSYILISVCLYHSQCNRDLFVLKTQGIKIDIEEVHTDLRKLHNILAEGTM